MTNSFTKRRGQETLNIQRLFLKHAQRCTMEVCQNTPAKITPDMQWDELSKAIMATALYKENPKLGEIPFNKILLDPMMVWMTIAEEHPSGVVRDAYLTRAKEHGPLQFHCIVTHFFPRMFDSQAALQEIQAAFERVASEWDLQSVLAQLPWFQSSVGDSEITAFLKDVLGVVGRVKKNRAGDELDNGNEFILRATGWQHECITGWLLTHCMKNNIAINGDSFFEHLYDRNELLAYMVRYFVKGDTKTLQQALKACRLGTATLLFRFARTDQGFMVGYRAIEKEFMKRARAVRNGFRENLQGSIDIEDWFSEYLEKRVLGALRIVPAFTHTDPKRHLFRVNKNFLTDKIRQFCTRLKLEEADAMRTSFDEEEGGKAEVVHEDGHGLAPGEDWTDTKLMKETNAMLEQGISNIRHRIAYLFKDVWGSVTVPWDIPDAWVVAFQAKLRYATKKEVTDLFDKLLVTQAELGMDKDQYRAHRDALKARLFKSNAETVERYFRLGRNALHKGRQQ